MIKFWIFGKLELYVSMSGVRLSSCLLLVFRINVLFCLEIAISLFFISVFGYDLFRKLNLKMAACFRNEFREEQLRV